MKTLGTVNNYLNFSEKGWSSENEEYSYSFKFSGGGKTTVTLGIMKALKNRGFKVQGYKVGPDYIDSAFHTKITGNDSRNLDLYLMGEAGVKASFSRGEGDLGSS